MGDAHSLATRQRKKTDAKYLGAMMNSLRAAHISFPRVMHLSLEIYGTFCCLLCAYRSDLMHKHLRIFIKCKL